VKRLPLVVLILGTTMALAPAAHAVLSTPISDSDVVVPHTISVGVTAAEQHALTVRGQALDAKYGNAVTALSPAQFKSLYLAGGYRLTPQEFAALVARSQALDTRYANHSAPTAHVRSTEQPGSSGSTIDWSYIGIAALAAMLLAAAAATVTRRGPQLCF